MQDTRLPVQTPPRKTASPLRLVVASVLGLVTLGLLALAGYNLYSILDIYGNLEGEPWDMAVALVMGFAAVTATVGMAVLRPTARLQLLIGTFLAVALVGAIIFSVLLLLM